MSKRKVNMTANSMEQKVADSEKSPTTSQYKRLIFLHFLSEAQHILPNLQKYPKFPNDQTTHMEPNKQNRINLMMMKLT